jgi:2-polyprenyl-3-methyl-5-hydroxy-6-metoxy-1,4-benzoquinol methylase
MHEDALVDPRILAVLKPPGAGDDVTLLRGPGAFSEAASGATFPDRDGIPSLLAGIEDDDAAKVTGRIKAFYEEHPFPSYEGLQDFGDLVSRGRANPFSAGLLQAIGYNKLILECGCGTGQLSQFLSLNNNHVLGIDLSRASLGLAVDFKRRNEIARASFVQMNIFALGIKDASFDVVISSGVLHHTKDARRAFAAIVKKAKPGGIVAVGLYNLYGRMPTAWRARLIGLLGPKIDYVVRNRIRDARKAEIWIKDQYYNPHETWHSIDEVLDWFAENQIDYLSCHPPILGTAPGADMFAPSDRGSTLARLATQFAWLGSISSEGALFVMIGRRRSG